MTRQIVYAAIVLLALVLIALALAPTAATANDPGCVAVGEAEGQQLFFCITEYGVACLWDPSPTLGAGVMSCDW